MVIICTFAGWNWGDYEFDGPTMSFKINGKTAFEVALAAVANANFQKTEATLEFHDAGADKDAQVVESMRFLIMNDPV